MNNTIPDNQSQQLNETSPQSLLTVGKFGTVHGIKGLVKVISSTEQATDIFNYTPWFIKITAQSQLFKQAQQALNTSLSKLYFYKGNQYLEVKVISWQVMKNDLFAKIDGFDDRELARLLNNHEIAINRALLPELSEDFYWVDLIGSKVVTTEGLVLGKVSSIMETGSNDVLVVKASTDAIDKKERLIPVIMDQVIISFNKETKLLTVTWDIDF